MDDCQDYNERLLENLESAVADYRKISEQRDAPEDLTHILNQPAGHRLLLARIKECADECRSAGISEAQIYDIVGEDILSGGTDQDD